MRCLRDCPYCCGAGYVHTHGGEKDSSGYCGTQDRSPCPLRDDDIDRADLQREELMEAALNDMLQRGYVLVDSETKGGRRDDPR
jgi:hypothetical protein